MIGQDTTGSSKITGNATSVESIMINVTSQNPILFTKPNHSMGNEDEILETNRLGLTTAMPATDLDRLLPSQGDLPQLMTNTTGVHGSETWRQGMEKSTSSEGMSTNETHTMRPGVQTSDKNQTRLCLTQNNRIKDCLIAG